MTRLLEEVIEAGIATEQEHIEGEGMLGSHWAALSQTQTGPYL